MLQIIIENLATLLESIIIIIFITAFLGSRYSRRRTLLNICIVILIDHTCTVLCETFIVPNEIAFLLGIGIFIVYSLLCLQKHIFQKIIVLILAYGVVALVHSIIPYIVSHIAAIELYELTNTFSNTRIFTLFFTKIICAYLFFVIINIKKKIYFNYSAKQFGFLVLEQILSIIMLFFITKGITATPKNDINHLILLFACCGVIAANILVFCVLHYMSKANEIKTNNILLQQQAHYQKQYMDDLKPLYHETKQMKHDLKNHMSTLHALLLNKKFGEAASYVESFSEAIDQINIFTQTGNDAIDAVINTKISICKVKNIKVIICSPYELDFIDPVDICAIISNLFDNAIEACERNGESIIFLAIEVKGDYLSIEMKNPIPKSILADNPTLISSKQDKSSHGLGTKSIRNIVSKHSGLVEFYEESHMFVCNILLKARE